jgi:hypothetical protein
VSHASSKDKNYSFDIFSKGHASLLISKTFTFNNISVISWRSVLLVVGNEVPGEIDIPVASH